MVVSKVLGMQSWVTSSAYCTLNSKARVRAPARIEGENRGRGRGRLQLGAEVGNVLYIKCVHFLFCFYCQEMAGIAAINSAGVWSQAAKGIAALFVRLDGGYILCDFQFHLTRKVILPNCWRWYSYRMQTGLACQSSSHFSAQITTSKKTWSLSSQWLTPRYVFDILINDTVSY